MAAGSEVNGSLTHLVDSASSRETAPDPTITVTEAGDAPPDVALVSAKVD